MSYSGTLGEDDLAFIADLRADAMTAGLSTERCDRASAEAAVDAAYVAAGLEPPMLHIWMDSPLGGAVAAAAVSQLGDQLGDQLWDQLWVQLVDQLGDQLGYELSGWRDSYWLRLYTAAVEIAGLPSSDRLATLTAAVDQIGWWWPQNGAVIMTDRPTGIHRDQAGRLHNEHGPALSYADGYTLHAVHGVRVPGWVIDTPDRITPDRIWAEDNTEIRRVMIEQFGWDRFITAAGLTAVDSCDDPGNPGHTIDLYDLPEKVYDQPVRVILVDNASPERDGTIRRFGLTVPVECGTALAAAAWTFDCTPDVYAGLQRAS